MRNAVTQWLDDGVRVEIRPKAEQRRDTQLRLSQRWKGQVAKARGEQPDDVWGRWKYDLLLPLKEADEREHERAVRERMIVRGGVAHLLATDEYQDANPRELTIEAAFDIVRSKDLRVRLYADWLTQIQRTEAEGGIVLQSSEDEREAAMYEQVDKAA